MALHQLHTGSKIHLPLFPGWRGSDVIITYIEKLAHIKLDTVPSFIPPNFLQSTPKILLELPTIKVHDILIIHFPFQGKDASLLLHFFFPSIIFRHIRNICICFKDVLIGRARMMLSSKMIHRLSPRWQQFQLPGPWEDYPIKCLWLSVHHYHQTLPQVFLPTLISFFHGGRLNTWPNWFLCPFNICFLGKAVPSTRLSSFFHQTAVLSYEWEQEDKTGQQKKNYQKLVSFKSGYSEELEVALWSDVEDFFKAEPPLLVPLLSSSFRRCGTLRTRGWSNWMPKYKQELQRQKEELKR